MISVWLYNQLKPTPELQQATGNVREIYGSQHSLFYNTDQDFRIVSCCDIQCYSWWHVGRFADWCNWTMKNRSYEANADCQRNCKSEQELITSKTAHFTERLVDSTKMKTVSSRTSNLGRQMSTTSLDCGAKQARSSTTIHNGNENFMSSRTNWRNYSDGNL